MSSEPLSLRVLPRDYGGMLQDHYARLCQELDRAIRRPASRAGFEAWARELRGKLWEAMRVEPEKGDLNARVVARRRKRGYVVENVVFESRPGFLVTGNLYLPEGRGPHPAVLKLHGHYPRGKHEHHVQAIGAALARAGIATLAIDMVGYGDRWFQGHREGVWLLAVGMSLPGLILWDNIRALDYLESRDDIDSTRIGVTGSSGGGNQTMYLAALDERVKVAVPVASAEVLEDQVVSGRCYCECVPGMLRFANASDVLALIAPRPLMIVVGVYDEVFPVLRARRAYLRVRRIYEMLGALDKLAYVEVYAGHGYTREMRLAAYRWLTLWLTGREEQLDESDLQLEPDTSPYLACLPQPEGESIASLYARRAAKLAEARRVSVEEWLQAVPELRARLVEEVFGGFPEEPSRIEELGVERVGGVEVEKLGLRTELDIVVPAALVGGEGAEESCLLYVTTSSAQSCLSNGRVWDWLERGGAVMVINYRGTGETASSEEVATKNSIVVGRHILGARVFDVLRAVDYLYRARGFNEVHLFGEREAGLPALFAAALDERVRSVRTLSVPSTLSSASGFSLPPSLFPPDLLKYADVPQVAAMVAPRPLAVENPLDPHLRPLRREEAEEIFEFTRRVYEALGLPHNFSLVTIDDIVSCG
ncbi:MAG: acetylxylan esterase [Thermofilaceae archaeon]